MRRVHGPKLILPFFGYMVLTLVMTWPLALHFGDAIPGDGFDGWQNYWNLWWVKQALVDLGQSPYFTTYLDYPSGVSLLFHTLNVFNGLWTLPVQLAVGLMWAYNAVVIFSFAVGGLGAYLLTRQVLPSVSRWPAWVAGVVFTFAPYHFAHLLGHMQLFSLEWIPFYVLYLLRAVEPEPAASLLRGATVDPRPVVRRQVGREVAKASFFLVLVGLCDWYYVMFCVLFTGLYLAYLLCARRMTWVRLGRAASVGAAGLALLAPWWIPMMSEATRASYMVPDPGQTVRLSADLLAFVTPSEMHPVWGEAMRAFSERFTTTTSERMVFAGFAPLLLAAIGLWRGRGRQRWLWAGVGAVFAVLALGPVLHVSGRVVWKPLPYQWLAGLPFVNISRSVSRFDVMVMLALGVLAAWGLAAVGRGRTKVLLGVLATALVCFEFLAVPYPLSPPDTPDFYQALPAEPDDFAVLNLPMDWDRPNYLLYQTAHGKRLTTAYTSRENPLSVVPRTPLLRDLRQPPQPIDEATIRGGQEALRSIGVRYVVIDRYQMPDETQRAWTLDVVARVFAGQPPIFEDQRLVVFRVGG